MKKPKILITGSSGQSGRAILLEFFKKQDWALLKSIDRVYVIEKAKKILHYNPVFNNHGMIEELDQ